MKHLFLFFSFLPLCVFSQDVIVKKNGSTILAKVNKVGTTEIEYKKWNNLEGPIYTINTSDVLAINYQNGEKDTFDETPNESHATKAPDNNTPRLIKKGPAENNEMLIKRYKTDVRQKGNPLKDDAPYCSVYLGVTKNSIISNEDVEISFPQDAENYFLKYFDIAIKNKTDHVIYIDKGNCFRLINGKDPYCYYNASEQTTVGNSGGGMASLGLGTVANVVGIGGIAGQLANAISVGGGSSTSSSTTYISQRIIPIPPHSTKNLCEKKVVSITKNKWAKTIDPNEDFRTYDYGERTDGAWCNSHLYASPFGLYKGDLKLGQVISFNEETTPYKRIYYLTYSNSENFSSYTTLEFTLFLQQAYGEKYWTGKGLDNLDMSKNDLIIKCTEAKLLKK